MTIYYEKFLGVIQDVQYREKPPPLFPAKAKLPSDRRRRFMKGDIVYPCFVPIDAYPHTVHLQIRFKQSLTVVNVEIRILKEGRIQILSFSEVDGWYESDFFKKSDS